MQKEEIIQALKDEYNHRKSKNHFYSVRSFARDINMSKTTLSAIFTGKRTPSLKTIYKIIDELPYLFPEGEVFKNLEGTKKLTEKDFSPISDWYYLAIFHLSEFPNNEASAQWVAKKISISEELAQEALDTLVAFNYIKIDQGKIVRTSRPISVESKKASNSIKNHHKQKLQMALSAIDKVPLEQRQFASITFPFSREHLPQLKELINSFSHKVRMEQASDNPDDIMSMSIQLIPLRGQYE